MTSKEALERLKDDIEINYLSTKHNNEKDKSNYLILLNSIEKDLEVLDILKRYFKYLKGEIIKEETNMSEKDVGRIKEWIEN